MLKVSRRLKENKLDVEFVGPPLGEFCVMTAIVVSNEQNPPNRILFGIASNAAQISSSGFCFRKMSVLLSKIA